MSLVAPWRTVRLAEQLWIGGILLLAALAHGINMFEFPYYESDEGTYLSQAWAVAKHGELAPYTYFYDHAPLGWIQIAAWTALTGGFQTFGTAVDSGRALMLALQVGSTFLVYRIARGSAGGVLAASIAALAFALSAYGLYYHRRVLLDNISTFWMLVSIALLVGERLTRKTVWLSGLALGTSILSKEVTIFLIPALAYLVFVRTTPAHRWPATIFWVGVVCSVVGLYVLLAIGQHELFPSGTWLGGSREHVSLLGTLQDQMARGRDGGILDGESRFWQMARRWAREEPFLVIVGSASAVISVLAIGRWGPAGVIGAAVLSLWAFLGRGGETLAFYLLPLLPLLAVSAGLALDALVSTAKRQLDRAGPVGAVVGRGLAPLVATLALATLPIGYSSPALGFDDNLLTLWNTTQTEAQRQSIAWARQNLAASDRVIVDSAIWTDLRAPRHGAAPFELVHPYWKAELDREVRDGVFGGAWQSVDYVISTPQMVSDARAAKLGLVLQALEHSTSIARFDGGGWPVDVRRVNKDR